MAESLLNTLGYDEEFIKEVEGDLVCLICHFTLREPVQTDVVTGFATNVSPNI